VDISDIAELLRFESQIDRLKVMEGRVNPQQLQRMRRLTPGTVTILRSRWEEDKAIAVAIQEAQSALRRGAGYGQAASNREIEVAAVQHVTQLLRAEGWVITSVEVKCGLRSVVSEKGKAAARGG
jgi:hypothetical protein